MADKKAGADDQEGSSWLKPLPEEYAAGEDATGRRMVFAGMTVLVLALFGGIIWYSYMQGNEGGPVPVVRADKSPVKSKPADPGGLDVPDRDKLVYAKVSGEEETKEDVLASSAELAVKRPTAQQPASEDVNIVLPPKPPSSTHSTNEIVSQEAKKAAAIAPSATNSGNFMIQLGAFGKKSSAENLWKSLVKKNGRSLGGLNPQYVMIDRGSKGVLYRLMAGAIEKRNKADDICGQLKKKKQACIVVKK